MLQKLLKNSEYFHVLLLNEIRETEQEGYKIYLNINNVTFDKLLELFIFFFAKERKEERCKHEIVFASEYKSSSHFDIPCYWEKL